MANPQPGKIPGGYVLKARKIDKSDISNAPPHVREIWDWLFRKANYKDKKIYGRTIKRGQCLTTYKEILDGLSWKVGYRIQRYSKGQCEISMKFLRKGAMITTTRTTRGMIVTILNYNYYQNPKNYENHNESHNENYNSSQQQDTINKKEKKEKNKEKEYSTNFLTFCGKYPGKINKAYAYQCWKKKKRPALEEILTAIENQKMEKAQLKAAGEFCPEWKMASTWINQECWDDDIQTINTQDDWAAFRARREAEGRK